MLISHIYIQYKFNNDLSFNPHITKNNFATKLIPWMLKLFNIAPLERVASGQKGNKNIIKPIPEMMILVPETRLNMQI